MQHRDRGSIARSPSARYSPAEHFRRLGPRIGIDALCWEIVGDRESSALAIDLSIDGVQLERPYVGGRIAREVPLQLEVPGIDEVMWARGDVVYDRLVPAPRAAGPFGLLRRTGFRIALAAARDLRLLRDFVYAVSLDREAESEIAFASCYARG